MGGGESALRLAREQTPDLILLDLLLPRISSMDVLRSLNGTRGRAEPDGRGPRSLGKELADADRDRG